jgi:MFS transporter, MHS family, proline/betaine transporter
MNESDLKHVDEQPRRIRDSLKPIGGAAVGNVLEWFDYSLYGYLAAVIAKTFFPDHDPAISLMVTFAAFAVAFAGRPIGGVVCGSLGDRLGRRDTLALVVSLISLSTFLVGVLPGYASIGVAAPILLVALRLLQGFSTGGEGPGAIAFLAEYAPTRHRGFVVGFYNMSGYFGVLAGSCLVLAITAVFGQTAVQNWAWRLPFLIAGPVGIAALWLRLKIQETPAFRASAAHEGIARSPVREAIREDRAAIAKCTGIAIMHGVPYYLILTYLPAYLMSSGRLSMQGVLTATGFAFLAAIIAIPFAAAVSDRWGRRPVALFAAFGYLIIAIPVFNVVTTGSSHMVIVGMTGLGVLLGIYGSAPFCMMGELFPTRTRYSAMSIGLNLGLCLAGGTTPFISALLVRLTGSPTAPAWYLIGGGVIAVVSIVASPETSRVPISDLGRDHAHIKKARQSFKKLDVAREPLTPTT